MHLKSNCKGWGLNESQGGNKFSFAQTIAAYKATKYQRLLRQILFAAGEMEMDDENVVKSTSGILWYQMLI